MFKGSFTALITPFKAGAIDVRPLSGTEASRAAVLSALPRSRYAHLATHGFFATKEFRSILQLDEKLFTRREYLGGKPADAQDPGARRLL